MSFEVLISLSSFGAAEVGRHGQLWCSQLAKRAGADSVEVRGEMLRDADAELPALNGLASVYSSPEGLWAQGGWLDSAALKRGIAAATRVGARRLKMSIGDFQASSHGSLWGLKIELAETRVELGMTFDMGNWHWLGECPLQAAQALGRRVRYVHCKGAQRLPHKWVAVPLADSAAPWRAVLRALPADVPHAIEYPLAGDDLPAVVRAQVDFIRAARG